MSTARAAASSTSAIVAASTAGTTLTSSAAAAATYTKTDLLHAYRKMYRSALRAVQFAKPARYVVRDQLRAGFRGESTTLTRNTPLPPLKYVRMPEADETAPAPGTTFDPIAIRRTIYFFNAAAESRGIEHRVLRNLLKTAYWRRRNAEQQQQSWSAVQTRTKVPERDAIQETKYDHYDWTVYQLNRTMRLCLR